MLARDSLRLLLSGPPSGLARGPVLLLSGRRPFTTPTSPTSSVTAAAAASPAPDDAHASLQPTAEGQFPHGYSPHGHLPNLPRSPYVADLAQSFFESVNVGGKGVIPTYRVLDGTGEVLDGAEKDAEISREEAVRMYEHMLLLPAIDVILYNSQRQGRISFMMTSHGEEASIIGSAAGLESTDEVFGQYRESGVLLWRGYELQEMMDQVFGNEHDTSGRGRSMPVHFGSPKHHFVTISSPLATQIPQAAGAGYALKRDPSRKGDVVMCYFGEGAASEGDFHAGLNMAATLKSPVIFFARNNQFAISTPAWEQYAGDGIASRGPAYGMPTVRVDGNDVLAVRRVVREAKRRALEGGGRPVLVEAMTYRVGHHSTSDDSSAYRTKKEVEDWKKIDNPLHRMRRFLESRCWWSEEMEAETRTAQRKVILEAFGRAEKKPKPGLASMFEDTYERVEGTLGEQRAELARLVGKYGQASETWRKELDKLRHGGKDLEAFAEGEKGEEEGGR